VTRAKAFSSGDGTPRARAPVHAFRIDVIDVIDGKERKCLLVTSEAT
jgi:hypothetical protein